jgi:hypothetical protein
MLFAISYLAIDVFYQLSFVYLVHLVNDKWLRPSFYQAPKKNSP